MTDSEPDSEGRPDSGAGGSPLRRILERGGRYSAKSPRVVVTVAVLLMVLSLGIAAMNVTATLGTQVYLGDDSPEQQDFDRLNDEFDRGKVAFVMVEADSITDPETIRTIEKLDQAYTDRGEFSKVRSLADVVKAGNGGTIPDTREGVEQSIERVRAQSEETEVLVENLYPEDGLAVISITYGNVPVPEGEAEMGGFKPKKEGDVVTETLRSISEDAAVPSGVEVTVTGQQVYRTQAFETVFKDMNTLLSTGFVLVLFVVYFVMRRRLNRGWTALLPFLTTVGAMIYMLGAMGVLGYRFNSVMMAIMPISLGLGVDYGLQIQTRYVQERDAGLSKVDAAGKATRTTGHTLALAMATTAIGLGSLLASPVPPTRQFGILATVSVVASMGLSCTLLVAMLTSLDVKGRGESQADPSTGGSGVTSIVGVPEKLVGGLSRLVQVNPAVLLVLLTLLVGAGAYAYPQVDTQDDTQQYWPQDLDARENIERLESAVSTPEQMTVIVDTSDPYSPATMAALADAEQRIKKIDGVVAVTSPASTVRSANGGAIPDDDAQIRQILESRADDDLSTVERPTDDSDAVLITVSLRKTDPGETLSIKDQIQGIVEDSVDAEEVSVTGQTVINRIVTENVTSGRNRMTALSFSLGLLFLLLVFRSAKPAVTIIGSVPVAAVFLVAGGMFLLDIPWNPGTVMMSSIVLGIGIDYGLHVYERLQEELESGAESYEAALDAALQKLSRPIVGSGLTTMIGFGIQFISAFPIVANAGRTLGIAMIAILFATFVILPAVLLVTRPGESKLEPTPA